ncbi:MAG: hypothetical protein ABSE96_01420 [Terracidiphilus sp.]|jgi:hypothetical protein
MQRPGQAQNLLGRFSSLTPRGLARFLATPVDLLEKMTQYSDEREREAGKQQDEGYRAPQRSIGRQSRLKARRDERHTHGQDREEAQRCSEYVEVARHGG